MKDFFREVLPFWEELREEHRQLILDTLIIRNFKKNDKFYHIERKDMGLKVVHKGRMRVFISTEDGNEMNLYRLGKNQVCALSVASMLHIYNISINMEAEEDMEGYVIPEKVYHIIYEEYASVKNFIYEVMASRLGDVIELVSNLAFVNVKKRLAEKILYHKSLQNSLEIIITHEELASDIGSAREVVSRTLKQFQILKLIESGRGKIRIMDEKGLENL